MGIGMLPVCSELLETADGEHTFDCRLKLCTLGLAINIDTILPEAPAGRQLINHGNNYREGCWVLAPGEY